MSDETARRMTQWAPWPEDLEAAVREFRYLEGWRFSLEDVDRDYADPATRQIPIAGGLTLIIFVPCMDSYHPERYRPVDHLHPVPAATFNRQSWERWLFDRLCDTLVHEAGEWSRFVSGSGSVADGGVDVDVRRPFAALHGPGDNPYVVHSLASVEQYRTSWLGETNPQTPDHA